ncbi:LOW QUALITY PROTEIN: hypothetical protein RJ640_015139 [Escallonia rubra]|uniref:glucan endo-1,3-beta-D-glucosidase n=1 Tax=Escallonia rubra TaxID=112253 RepID=A0AA88QHG6_9ASTE|nr:LOW QUALITY PROTEIN: hypothetical protein RJ640_015139 [Escallonia rubra]
MFSAAICLGKWDSGLWFAPPDWKECRLRIQVLPLLPITEALFSDVGFARELVKWTLPALEREGVGDGWKGFVFALEGIYDNESALNKIRNLNGFDDGHSLSNLLWWIHKVRKNRDVREEENSAGMEHYCSIFMDDSNSTTSGSVVSPKEGNRSGMGKGNKFPNGGHGIF